MGEEIKSQALGKQIKATVWGQGAVARQLAPRPASTALLTLVLINKGSTMTNINLTDWGNYDRAFSKCQEFCSRGVIETSRRKQTR